MLSPDLFSVQAHLLGYRSPGAILRALGVKTEDDDISVDLFASACEKLGFRSPDDVLEALKPQPGQLNNLEAWRSSQLGR